MRNKILALTIMAAAIMGTSASAYTERTLNIYCDDYGNFMYSCITEDGYFIEEDDEEIGIDDGVVSVEEWDDEEIIIIEELYDDGVVIVEE